ncbi:MAG: flavodoxin family protein [Peptostreptococcaceae bacterium]
MKICLFNGMYENNDIEEFLIRHIDKHEINHLKIREMNIEHCKACGACSKLKKCVQKDDGFKIIEGYKDSDIIIFLTPIIYGAYSKELKKAIDRTMPIGDSKLLVKDGYMTHRVIYNNKKIIVIGVLEKEDHDAEVSFGELVKANYYNMDWKSYSKEIIYTELSDNEINDKIESALKEMISHE